MLNITAAALNEKELRGDANTVRWL